MMNKTFTRAQIARAAKRIIVASIPELSIDKIKMKANLQRDLGIDSLDVYELIYACEEKFGISIPDEKANEFTGGTLKDGVNYIHEALFKDGRAPKPRIAKAAKTKHIIIQKSDIDKILNIVADKYEWPREKVRMKADIQKDLGLDSLDTYELLYNLEEEFGLNIPDEKANEMAAGTVKDLVRNVVPFIKMSRGAR
jgi:acyl carrier protein